MKFWHEIPSESRNELKQKLLETIVSYANGPKLVLNRLCISVSIIRLIICLNNHYQYTEH